MDPVSEVYELAAKAKVQRPDFLFTHEDDGTVTCFVSCDGVGDAIGEARDVETAKKAAARNLLESKEGQAAKNFVLHVYGWTEVKNKSMLDLASILVARAEMVQELVANETKYPPVRRAELRNRVSKLAKQLGVLYSDYTNSVSFSTVNGDN